MKLKDYSNLKEMLIDFNEYSTDYTKTRCRELEETIKNTLKEIERLNNIINELEEYIHNELILDFYNDDMPCELIINKIENMIKKLKAGDKE